MDINLNTEQRVAVEHGGGPLLIIAGAGTGKTTVIVERIKNLIAKDLASPSEILALTFTEKAAREMEERVDVAMPYGYEQMWIMTFHGFCDQLLCDDGVHAGFDPEFNLLTESESIQFMRDNFDALKLDYFAPLGNPHKFVRDLLTHFSRLADEDVAPSDYIAWANSKLKTKNEKLSEEEKLEAQKYKELSRAYETYTELKAKRGVMDFSDLITNSLRLFRKRSNVLRDYRRKFKYILVDEYQDTNFSQNELVKLLVGKNGNITVVADDDQSIYKWRGAAVSNVVQFRKSFPKAKLVTLTTNYRSNQNILDHAYKLIRHNDPDRLEVVEGIDKKLVAKKKGGSKNSVKFIHTNSLLGEVEEVIKEIKLLSTKRNSKYIYSDIAILVRANNHAKAFEHGLSQAGIPNMFLGPGKLFEEEEIVDLVSYLKFLTDPDDSVALYRLLSSGFLEINSYDLLRLSNKANKRNVKLYSYLDPKILKTQNLPKGTSDKLSGVRKLLEKSFRQIHSKTAGELLYNYIEEIGYLQKLVDPDTEGGVERAQNVAKLFDRIRNYESTHEDKSVFAITDWIDLSKELGEAPLASDTDWTQSNSVKLLTIHSAKGLEFPVVFLVNLVNQRFPSMNRRDRIPISDDLVKEELPAGDSHLQEERRLFYVGLTRAKDKVYLTAADFYGEAKRQKKLSPFINEALGREALGTGEIGSKYQVVRKTLRPVVKGSRGRKIINTVQKNGDLSPITQLSYTQIQTFKICPLHYKLRYILRLPTPKTPALSFGTSVHDTLEDYYQALMNGKRMTKKQLLKRLKINWINEGYKTKLQEKRSYARGEKYLSGYFKLHGKAAITTYATEQKLTASIGKGSNRIKISGKIDRVDVTPGGLEVIDYKTGEKIPTQSDVDRDEQLTFYALLISKVRQKPYSVDLDKVKLNLYYLKEQKKLTTTRTLEQVKEYEKEIFRVKGEIEKSDFKCSGNIICRDCEYKLFCGD